MRTRFLTGDVVAKHQTGAAFLCSFDWSDTHGYAASDQWVPMSVILPEDHPNIEVAADGDIIEISIAAWWLEQKIG